MRTAFALLVIVALAATADARFADTQGFSGKHGVTCVSCHFPEAVELGTPATVNVAGLPAAWDWSQTYALQVRVDGGPPPNPAPDTPQAGFDLEVDVGVLGPGPGMEGLLRFPSAHEATYTGDGTFVREWDLVWTAPVLGGFPRNATFWVAVVAANGNHVMGAPEVTGERGDRAASAVFTVPPAPGAVRAWEEQPLSPPVLDTYSPPGAGLASVVTGRVPDFADGAQLRVDDGPWHGATGTPGFSYPLLPWTTGPHTIAARTVWRERLSEETTISFHVDGPADAAQASVDASPSRTGLIVFLSMLLVVPLIPVVVRLRR